MVVSAASIPYADDYAEGCASGPCPLGLNLNGQQPPKGAPARAAVQ
jgi:hypothetical protein